MLVGLFWWIHLASVARCVLGLVCMRLCLFYCEVCVWISWHCLAKEKEAAATLWLVLTRCARCREKGAGSDPCVQGKDDCAACLLLTPEQRKQLATPTYKLHKEKKSCGKTDVFD